MHPAPYFHYTFAVKAREGIYHVRLYTLPMDTNGQPLDYHRGWLKVNAPEKVMPSSAVLSMGAFDVESENEFAQGNPRLGELPIELAALPEFISFFKAVRSDRPLDIWIEVTLEQPVTDTLPAGSQAANKATPYPIVWPMKTRSIFWGKLDRKTLKGRVDSQQVATPPTSNKHAYGQRLQRPNDYIQANRTHRGSITMSFTHWVKFRGEDDVKSFLDGVRAANGVFSYLSVSDLFTQLIESFVPLDTLWVSSSDMFGSLSNYLDITLPFETSADGITWTNKLKDQYIGAGSSNQLFYYADSDSIPSTSLYHWKNYSEAIASLAGEFFLYPQLELPTLERAQLDNAADCVVRMLVLPQLSTFQPLQIFIDPNESTIEYTPCAVYASSYKVDEPTTQDLHPFPSARTANSVFPGGTDSNYTTLFRLLGQSLVNGVLIDDPRGWELYNPDGHGGYAFVRSIRFDGQIFNDWAAFHAYARVSQWGSVRGMVTLTTRGVGIEPFGYSAKDNAYLSTIPKNTFGLHDWSEFPLYRSITLQPGLLSNPDDDEPTAFITIGVKRTPNGDTELKLLEVEPFAFVGSVVGIVPPIAPPPKGPPDPPVTSLVSPAAGSTVSHTQNIKVNATNTFGIAQVTVQIDGLMLDTQIASRSSNQWTVSWDTTKWSNGVHTIKAIAYDLGGSTTTAVITVTVSN